MLEDLRCVSKFHISNLTPLMLAAGISPCGSCCRRQVTLQPPILKGLSKMYPTVAGHFLGVPGVFVVLVVVVVVVVFVTCPSVMTSGTDRAIIALPEPHCAIPPLQPPRPARTVTPPSLPPSFPPPRKIAFPALTRHGGSGPRTQSILYNIYIYIYIYIYIKNSPKISGD